MPIYEYQCTSCHHQFDLMQKVSDAPAQQCPQCFENSLVKLVSAAGFQLKGSGWYVTDFKNKDKPDTKTPGKQDTKTENNNKTTEKVKDVPKPAVTKGEKD